MTFTNHPKGTPLPDNHPLKGGLVIFGGRRPVPSTPTLVLPEDPMHKALAEAQAKMTPEQRLAFIKKLMPPDSSPPTQEE